MLKLSKNNHDNNENISLLSNQDYSVNMLSGGMEYNIDLTKNKKEKVLELISNHHIRVLSEDESLKTEPINHISFVEKNGSLALLFYEANNSTYIEEYNNGKKVKTYLIEEFKILNSLYGILK